MALNRKQRGLLDLLKRVAAIMEENDIQFFLFGGSILGALRHNGFIPWDDDIDLLISSDGYYKLLEVFEKNPPDDIDLVSVDTCEAYYRPFAMLVDKRDTCFTRPGMFCGGRALGTRLDLMIYDYVREDRLDDYHHQLLLLQDVITDSFVADEEIYTIKDEYYAWKEKERAVGKRAVEAELRKSLEAFSDEEGADQITVRFWTPFLRHCDADIMLEPQYHDFEGAQMPIPAKPIPYMRYLYGYDWYVVPGQEDYGSHLFYDNPFVSSNNYYEDVIRFVDMDEARETVKKRKAVQIERMAMKKKRQQYRADYSVQRTLLRLDLDKNARQIRAWRDSASYGMIRGFLEPLLKKRQSFERVEPPYKKIPDSVLLDWVHACIMTGFYYEGTKICDMLEVCEGSPLQGSYELRLLERVKALAAAYQDDEVDGLATLLDGFSEDERTTVPDCILAFAKCAGIGSGRGEKAQAVVDLCDSYLQVVEDNWDIVKVRGDALWALGREEEAMECYVAAHDNTRNGLDLLELEQRFGFEPRFTPRPDEDD